MDNPNVLPDEINRCIMTLWNYADDALLTYRTKEELLEEGFECEGSSAHYIVFVLPKVHNDANKKDR